MKLKNMFNSSVSLHKIIQVSSRNQLEDLLMHSKIGKSANSSHNTVDRQEKSSAGLKDDKSISFKS